MVPPVPVYHLLIAGIAVAIARGECGYAVFASPTANAGRYVVQTEVRSTACEIACVTVAVPFAIARTSLGATHFQRALATFLRGDTSNKETQP
jgi:hypothetical protein